MQRNILYSYSILLGLAIISCNNNSHTGEHINSSFNYSDYNFVPLAELKYDPATVAIGTELEILARLGGPESNCDTVYFYQFIVLNRSNGDTIRVLCPQFAVDGEKSDAVKTNTSPLIFDESAGVTTAYYELIDTTKSLLFNGTNMQKIVTSNDDKQMEHIFNPANAIKIVVLDKRDIPERIFRFKTVVGVLYFKKIPWIPN